MLRLAFIVAVVASLIFYIHNIASEYDRLFRDYSYNPKIFCDEQFVLSMAKNLISVLEEETNKNGKITVLRETREDTSVERIDTSMQKVESRQGVLDYEYPQFRTRVILNRDKAHNAQLLFDNLVYLTSSTTFNLSHPLYNIINKSWNDGQLSFSKDIRCLESSNIKQIRAYSGFPVSPILPIRNTSMMVTHLSLKDHNMHKAPSFVNFTTGALVDQYMIMFHQMSDLAPNQVNGFQTPSMDRISLFDSGIIVWERYISAEPGGWFPGWVQSLNILGNFMANIYVTETKKISAICKENDLKNM
ncbi:hypothetical protein AKO1_002172 [Acrasis kona]|uniref:Transmembrane protein 231 n=1 Tax=Acrasis kona TaxID=1008807 RepID=A0AAW2Z9C0_9EUKA